MVADDHTARPRQGFMLPRRGRRIRTLSVMVFTIGTFWIASLIFSAKGLPDYESYERIYEIGGLDFAQSSREPLFVAVNQAGKLLGLDYEQFRSAILLVSIGLLSIVLFRVDRWLRYSRLIGNITKPKMHPEILIITPAAFLVFLLEFFQVRLRAGLALSLVSFAFSFYLTEKRPNAVRNLIATATLFLLGYSVHAWTALVLGYFLFAPILYDISFSKLRSLFSAPVSRTLIFCLVLAISFYIVFFVSTQAGARGEHLASPLNRFRLLSISVAPLLLMVWDYFLARRPGKVGRERDNRNASADFDHRVAAVLQRRLSWITFSTVCYLALALALLVLEAAGVVSQSGEAIARVFTLSSVPAIFVILLGPSRYSRIWVFLLLINSLFFVHTLGADF